MTTASVQIEKNIPSERNTSTPLLNIVEMLLISYCTPLSRTLFGTHHPVHCTISSQIFLLLCIFHPPKILESLFEYEDT